MRITVFILTLNLLSIHAVSFSQKTDLDARFDQTPLKEVIQYIESNTDFRFLYNEKSIEGKYVTMNVKNADIQELLQETLRDTENSYRILDKNLIVISSLINNSQQVVVKGKVTDSQGNSLPGVNVVEKGTTIGAVTDLDGNYTINVSSANAILAFSFVGYLTEEIEVGGKTNLDVVLVEDIKALDEVVVIGYGSRKKSDITGAVSSVTSEEINREVKMSPESAIQGKLAGVFVSNTGNSPTARPTVRIRGVGTIGFNDPLYVVDGIPLTEGGASSEDARERDLRGTINVLNMINPNDIESISVLKDASATAIYGVRAANGVILIQTKRGAKGKPKVSASARYGIQNLNKRLDVMTTKQAVDAALEAWANNPTVIPDPDTYRFFDSSNPNYVGNYPTYTDQWIDNGIVKNASIQDYNVSVSGGTEASNFATSVGYSSQEDVISYNKFDRYSFSLNSDHNLTKWLKVGESYRFVYTDNDRKPETYQDNDPTFLAYRAPWQPLKDDGSIPNMEVYNGWALPGRTLDGSFTPRGYGAGTTSNPGMAEYEHYQNLMFRNLGTFYAEISPIKGLRLRGTFSFDRYNYDQEDYLLGREPGLFSSERGTIYGESEANKYRKRTITNTNIVKEFLIGYNNTFGKHNVDIVLNAMDQSINWEKESKSIDTDSPITSWEQRRIEEGWPGDNKNLFYLRTPSGLQGYMGRLSYNFDYKYYIDGTIRRDGSSKFGSGYKWGTFPSFAAAWRISSEKFMSGVNFIDDLKIRGGWGEVGNQETADFAFLLLVNFNPKYAVGSDGSGNGAIVPAAVLGDFPIEDMSWETSKTTNIGFDAIVLNNRLAFSAEYYQRVTEGILQSIDIPLVVGALYNPYVNLATVQNRGVEIQADFNDKIGDFGYNVSFNLTTVDNEVKELYRNRPSGDEYGRIEEGYSMNYLWGLKTDGIFQTDQEVADWLATTDDPGRTEQKSPGDIRFVDIHGAPTEEDGEDAYLHKEPDGQIDAYDRTYLGKTIAGYYYGINLGANYKSWDLSINFRGVGDVQDYNYIGKGSIASAGGNYDAAYLDRWTSTNPSSSIPRAVMGDPSGNNRLSDHYVEDKGFFRFQNAQIGYNFSGGVLNKLGASNMRAYVSGSNLFVITPWTGLDPENDLTPITFMLGVNLDF